MADEHEEQLIPLARLNEKQTRIDELEQALAGAKKLASETTKWKTKFEEERTAHETTRKTSAQRMTLLEAGLTDAGDQQLVVWKYGQLPEADRPGLAEWLAGGAREDKHLSGLFVQQEAPKEREGGNEGAGSEEKPPPAAPPVGENSGAKPPPAPKGDLTAEQIAKMSPEEWSQAREEVLQRYG